MGRYKKGQTLKNKDLWTDAGGRDAIIKAFISKNISKKQKISSQTWSNLAMDIFQKTDEKLCKWLSMIWNNNRRGIQTEVLCQVLCGVLVDLESGSKDEMKYPMLKDGQELHHQDEARQQQNDQTEHMVLEEQRCIENDEHTCNSELYTNGVDLKTGNKESELGSLSTYTNNEEEEKEEQEPDQENDHDYENEQEHENEHENDKNNKHENDKNNKEWRATTPGPKQFSFELNWEQWEKIKPLHGSNQLQRPWTDVLYKEFTKISPCCVLCFKYQHVKCKHSRKRSLPFFRARAICTFKGCAAVFTFTIKKTPTKSKRKITVFVARKGDITHKTSEKKFRQAKHFRRGKIAKAIQHGVSNYYYQALNKSPSEEIVAGNISRCLTKDVLRVISSELKKSTRLHDDIIMELVLTQKIMKECATSEGAETAGYLQQLQVDPFVVHMYTQCGLHILAQHLKNRKRVTLHLDATGSVTSRIPGQPKKVLYYALVLPGMGKNMPPLPVSELLTNQHSIPTLSFWLMETLRALGQITSCQVHQVETDFSWGLMSSVLLAFNKESISIYLQRAHRIVSNTANSGDQQFTVLHLCSSHIIKAVSLAFSKKTDSKALKEYATYCFALLLNSTHLEEATAVFEDMCVLLTSPEQTDVVNAAKASLDLRIMKTSIQINESETMQEATETPQIATPVCDTSPFKPVFGAILERVRSQNISSNTGGKNSFFCPEFIDVLMNTYMSIFPLWSGVLLGDLSRFSKISTVSQQSKTRETNCHVEEWFWIVKQSILQTKKYFRPADFIHKMYGSLQARYKEHIMNNNLSLPCRGPQPKENFFSQKEEWAKKTSQKHQKRRTKYFDPPYILPKPSQSPKNKHINTSQMKNINAIPDSPMDLSTKGKNDNTEPDKSKHTSKDITTEIEYLWAKKDTEVVVAVVSSEEKNTSYTIHHSEFKTLQPHKWLVGEIIECYFQVILNKMGKDSSIYLLNHYTSQVIMTKERDAVCRQSLRKVDFGKYEAAISFLNVNENHWKFLYLHASSSQIFVINPQGTDEEEDSEQAAIRFSQYFKMRQGKNEWVEIEWRGATIKHTIQHDAYSCGVFVMQMAWEIINNFPEVPSHLDINSSKTNMKALRQRMAEEILTASVFRKDECCAFCGLTQPLGGGPTTDWIECHSCERWYHVKCLSMTPPDFEKAKLSNWACDLCK